MMSLANMAVCVSLVMGISLMYKVKRCGPKIEPRRTAAATFLQVDLVPLMETENFLLCR